jgi:hypothetical protein
VTYTTQKIETQEVVEDYQVQVQQYRTEVRKIQVPKTVSNWVEVPGYRMVPKTVVMRVPVGSYDDSVLDGTTTYYAPPPPAAAAPTLPPRIQYGQPRRVDPSTPATQPPVQRPAQPAVPVAPADTNPSLRKPAIQGPLNGPTPDPNAPPAADPAAPPAPAPADPTDNRAA